MITSVDHVSPNSTHGWTRDNNGTVWYWEVPNTGETVEFRTWGYPTNHPIKHGDVPDDVRDHAQTYVDAKLEENDTPWY